MSPLPWAIKVVVLNGSGDIVYTRSVASRIQALSYKISHVGKATSFTYLQTEVYYPPGGEAIGVRLAKQLGVPAQPLPGGVYVDGRTEVYDVDFLRTYIRQIQRPTEWQAEMDRRGIQTVCLFHWWPNHQALVRFLATDPRWAMVYYDETSVIAVRRAGNFEAIERSEAFFPEERSRTEAMLLESPKSWQWQIARARGNRTYASVLAAMNRGSEAGPFYERFRRLTSNRD